jgi:hypothetical protein
MSEEPVNMIYLLALVTGISLTLGTVVWLIFITEPGQKTPGDPEQNNNV